MDLLGTEGEVSGFGVLGSCKTQVNFKVIIKLLTACGEVGPGIPSMDAPQLPVKTLLSYVSFFLVK